MNMTPQQAAEVLREMCKLHKLTLDNYVLLSQSRIAAIEMAIECLSAPLPTDEDIEDAAMQNSGCTPGWHDHDCCCGAFEDGAKWMAAQIIKNKTNER